MPQQLRDLVVTCTLFSLALDESTDICDEAQLSILMQGNDDNFNIYEELLILELLLGKTRVSDIFHKVNSCLGSLQIDSCELFSVCSDGALSMIGQVAWTTTLLENSLSQSHINITALLTTA